MDYLLSCDCGPEFTLNPSQAGQEIPCACGKSLSVPTLRGLSQLPRATKEENTPAKAVGKRQWAGWQGPVIAAAFAGFLISLGCAGWFGLQRSMVDTSYTIESEIEAGDELFDTYSPEELSLVWNNYEEVGLGPKDPPDFFLWNLYAADRTKYAAISGSIAAVSGLIVVAVWLSAPKATDIKD